MIDFIAIIVVLMYIWFDTDAFIEWAKFLHLKFFKYQAYQDLKNTPAGRMMVKTYTDFLAFQYGKFFLIKLVSCSVCLSAWLSIFAAIILHHWTSFGQIMLSVWVLYYGFKWFIRKTNE